MNTISFPVQVAVLLRRLVNVISTLSISNQYLLLKHTEEESSSKLGESSQEQEHSTALSWRPWWKTNYEWDWPRSRILEGMNHPELKKLSPEHTCRSSGLSMPWFERLWLWPSSLATQTETLPDRSQQPPPPQDRPKSIPSSPAPRPPLSDPEPETDPDYSPQTLDAIHQLIQNPALYDPLRTPRYPIALCHGLYGFDVRGPSSFPGLRMQYWLNVLSILRDKVGAEVIVTSVPGTGSISSRSESMHRQLNEKARGRGINFLAHSMGGLDCRHLITHIKPTEYTPLSLTSISTPHRGSPFMDWCAANIGIGKLREQEQREQETMNVSAAADAAASKPKPDAPSARLSMSLSSLPSSFTTLILSILDSPAYANLTTHYLNTVFNPATPDDPRVKYFSVAGRLGGNVSVWHPFWLPKMVLDGVEEKERGRKREEGNPIWEQEHLWGNDGLVTVQSAQWGEFLGVMEGCDHWEMRGARGIELGVDIPGMGMGGNGSSSVPSPGSSDGWSFKEWGRFVGAWKKVEGERIKKDAVDRGTARQEGGSGNEREKARELERERDDAIVKSSTDKLSAVFDWLSEQVPRVGLGGGDRSAGKEAEIRESFKSGVREAENAEKGGNDVSQMKRYMDREAQGKGRRKNELANKMDLERFYVALTRKLYDEGL